MHGFKFLIDREVETYKYFHPKLIKMRRISLGPIISSPMSRKRKVQEESETTKKQKVETEESVVFTEEDLSKKKVVELKSLAESFNLSTKGLKKADLVDAILTHKGIKKEDIKVEEPLKTSIFEFVTKDLDGNEVKLDQFKGKVCLIVNVASKCGRTKKHYSQLIELDKKYKEKGLVILAFPCNQFGSQESKPECVIKDFVKDLGVEFHVFSKIFVNGKNTVDIFKFLKKSTGGKDIPWNFAKFLCDKEGKCVFRLDAGNPFDLEEEINKLF